MKTVLFACAMFFAVPFNSLGAVLLEVNGSDGASVVLKTTERQNVYKLLGNGLVCIGSAVSKKMVLFNCDDGSEMIMSQKNNGIVVSYGDGSKDVFASDSPHYAIWKIITSKHRK